MKSLNKTFISPCGLMINHVWQFLCLLSRSLHQRWLLLPILFVPLASGQTVTTFYRNTTIANYSIQVQTSANGGSTWSNVSGNAPYYYSSFSPGSSSATASYNNGYLIRVLYGPASGTPVTPMRLANDGSTVFEVNGSGDTPYFEIISVNIYGGGTISEGNTTPCPVSRSGSTSYALTVHFTRADSTANSFSATGDFTKDWSIHNGSNYIADSIIIPAGSASRNATIYVWADGGGWEDSETAVIRLIRIDDSYELQSGATTATVTIPANYD